MANVSIGTNTGKFFNKISFYKAISWRLIGSLDTLIISFLFIGKIDTAMMISGVEVVTKIALYYLHDTMWSKILNYYKRQTTPIISMIKSFTWRLIGSLDTTLISWLVTGNLTVAFGITGIEVVSKMILFYFHERLWLKTSTK